MKHILLMGLMLFALTSKAQTTNPATGYFEMVAYIDQPISCYGNGDGYIQINNSVANPNYLYFLKLGKNTFQNKTGSFFNLKPGTYTVWATNGTQFSVKKVKLKMTQPKVLRMEFEILKPATQDVPLADLQVNIFGGTNSLQNYLVTWYNMDNERLNTDDTNMATQLFGLPPGKYKVVIEDDNGCFAEDYKTLPKPRRPIGAK